MMLETLVLLPTNNRLSLLPSHNFMAVNLVSFDLRPCAGEKTPKSDKLKRLVNAFQHA